MDFKRTSVLDGSEPKFTSTCDISFGGRSNVQNQSCLDFGQPGSPCKPDRAQHSSMQYDILPCFPYQIPTSKSETQSKWRLIYRMGVFSGHFPVLQLIKLDILEHSNLAESQNVDARTTKNARHVSCHLHTYVECKSRISSHMLSHDREIGSNATPTVLAEEVWTYFVRHVVFLHMFL